MGELSASEVKKELQQYIIKFSEDQIKNGLNISGKDIYPNFFTYPVKRIFCWIEEDWSGDVFVIFDYKGFFVIVDGFFGSCCGCDEWEGIVNMGYLQEQLNKVFSNVMVYKSLYDININTVTKYRHRDLQVAFMNFLTKSEMFLSKDNNSKSGNNIMHDCLR